MLWKLINTIPRQQIRYWRVMHTAHEKLHSIEVIEERQVLRTFLTGVLLQCTHFQTNEGNSL